MKIYNKSAVWATVNEYPHNFIRLTDEDENSIIPWNSAAAPMKQRLEEIKQVLSAKSTPEDKIFIIQTRTGTRGKPNNYFVSKTGKEAEEKTPLSDQKIEVQQVKSEIITDADLLELRVKCERLEMELDAAQIKIEELEDQILNENETALSDEGGVLNKFSWLKDVLPSLADSYFASRAQDREIEQAKIGLEYQKLQANATAAQLAPKEIKQETMPTLKQLEEFKTNNINGFYMWLSDPVNNEYYNNLTNKNNDTEF